MPQPTFLLFDLVFPSFTPKMAPKMHMSWVHFLYSTSSESSCFPSELGKKLIFNVHTAKNNKKLATSRSKGFSEAREA